MTPVLSNSTVALVASRPGMLGTMLAPVITPVLSTSRTMMRHYVVFMLMLMLMFVLVFMPMLVLFSLSMVNLVAVVFLGGVLFCRRIDCNESIKILPREFVMLHVLMCTANSLDKNCGQKTKEEKLYQDAFATSATRRSR